jgi:lactate dehydrogenase-like 2-hydroxyacid dehydrogenase
VLSPLRKVRHGGEDRDRALRYPSCIRNDALRKPPLTKVDILLPIPMMASVIDALADGFTVHRGWEMPDAAIGGRVRGIANGNGGIVDRALIERLPNLQIIANFGVGYDSVDVAAAAERGIVVTNTPDVLTEEVADTAIGLLLMTARELSAAERYLRAGRWASEGPYPLTRASLRNRTVGIVGLGRIGCAIARRLDAMGVPVVYHSRNARADVAYRHYPDLTAMAADVDTLICVLPGGAATRHLVDAGLLRALGPEGILINIGRGSTVDEAALIEALKDGTILAAGLDVYPDEPNVSAALIALPNAVLLPHVASASVHTREAMGKLVVDNLTSWFETGRPLTPVPETPWPRAR